MDDQEVQVIYFDEAGPNNTGKTLEIVRRRAEELGIESIVIATTTGNTAVQAVEALAGFNLVAVTHVTGFREPNGQEMPAETRLSLEDAGVGVVTAAHAFGGVGRAVRRRLETYQVDEIIAHTLRLFSEGVKVAIEVSLMAADAGQIIAGEEVIAIAGTNSGADTALVLLPTNTHRFFDLRVLEILCMPRP